MSTQVLFQYRLGFINLVDRPTMEVTELKRGEEKAGVEQAIQTILTYKPKVVCFIGKVTYNKFRGTRDCTYGWQENIGASRVYVMHFPIRGPADIRIQSSRMRVRSPIRRIRLVHHQRKPRKGSGSRRPPPDSQSQAEMVSENCERRAETTRSPA
jgi:hypothetical protein